MRFIMITMKVAKKRSGKTGRPLSFDRRIALEKAMFAFWRHGYESTSVNDLIIAMGINAPSLYTAYGDKKHLFLEAARLYAGSPDDIERALFRAKTAGEAAHTMLVESAKAFTGKHTPKGCLLASATASGSKESADVQAAVADIRREIAARLLKRINQDIIDGKLPQSTDAASLAAMIIALIQGMSVLARDGADRATLIALAKTAMLAWPR